MARSTVPATTVLPDSVLRRVTHNVRLHFFSYSLRVGISFRFQMPDKITKYNHIQCLETSVFKRYWGFGGFIQAQLLRAINREIKKRNLEIVKIKEIYSSRMRNLRSTQIPLAQTKCQIKPSCTSSLVYLNLAWRSSWFAIDSRTSLRETPGK